MNLSSKVVVNSGGSGGETLTVTCYTCGMPSSKEWAQKTRSRPVAPNKQFFPFLLQMQQPPGAILTEEGSTYLCAFCHASLESQWNNYEIQANPIPSANRKYFVHKFICAVCSVETYRKRVRALPFQEFPFLVSKRQPGSLTLGNNPLAVVCLDCSETLWAQSAEYDRWGLPIHKRHFNWMARPPPPEDSVEATVARLPSGETQLPRCPPTEPLIPSKFSQQLNQPETITPVKTKAKITKLEVPLVGTSGRSVGRSPVNSEPQTNNSGRKVSITNSSTSVIDTMSAAPSQPPIVTVAPMSSYNTLSNIRKESMSVPPTLTSAYSKYDAIPQPCGMQTSLGPPSLYPRSSLFPSQSPSFPTFPWPGRESSYGEHFPYSSIPNTGESLTPQSSSWSWLQSPSSDLLRYQSFMSSFQNRGYGDIYLNHPQQVYGGSSPPNLPVSSGGPSSTPYLSPYRLQTSPSEPQYTNTVSVASSQMGSSISSVPVSMLSSPYDETQAMVSVPVTAEYANNEMNLNTTVASTTSEISQGESQLQKVVSEVIAPKKLASSRSSKLSCSSTTTESSIKSSSLPKKSYIVKRGSGNDEGNKPSGSCTPPNGSSRTTPYCKTEERERTIVSSATLKEKSGGYVGKKWQWQTHIRNNSNTNNEIPREDVEPIDCSVKVEKVVPQEANEFAHESETDCAIDLSVSSVAKASLVKEETVSCTEPVNTSGSKTSNKFMIAYLCKSETISPPLNINNDNLPPVDLTNESGRSSVIVSTTKSEGCNDSSVVSPLHNLGVPDSYEELGNKEKKEAIERGEIFSEILPKSETTDTVCINASSSEKTNVCNEGIRVVNDCHGMEINALDSLQDVQTSKNYYEDERELENNREQEKAVRETIAEYVQKKKEEKKISAIKEKEQSNFLAELGLITPEQKTEIELNILISRCEHKTLPPLKLRAETSPKVKLREEFEHQLLQIAFDDPSLKQSMHNPSQTTFLGTLGLKVATKNDKNRRESEWRLVLTERIMREKRDSKLRGTKRPWDSYGDISNLLTPITKLSRNDPTVLESLSLTMPPDLVVNTSRGCHTDSSDLLTTVDNRELEKDSNTSTAIKNGMSIVYPKYIPSYAQSSVPEKSEGVEKELPKARISSILNVPAMAGILQNFHPLPPAGNPEFKRSRHPDITDTKVLVPTNSQPLLVPCGNILKVPVVTPCLVGTISRRGSFTSCNTDDTDDLLSSNDETDLMQQNYNQPATSIDKDGFDGDEQGSTKVDMIKKLCSESWKKTREEIEAWVSSSVGEENSKTRLTHAAEDLKKLRRCLKLHQADVKSAEKMLKIKEKQIFKQLRAVDKSKNTHVQRNKSKESAC